MKVHISEQDISYALEGKVLAHNVDYKRNGIKYKSKYFIRICYIL